MKRLHIDKVIVGKKSVGYGLITSFSFAFPLGIIHRQFVIKRGK